MKNAHLEELVLRDLKEHYGSVFSQIYYRYLDNRTGKEEIVTSTDILSALLSLKSKELIHSGPNGRWYAERRAADRTTKLCKDAA